MSLVADGPLIQVVGRAGSSSATASGTSATTWSARTTHTCRSGTRVSARRPSPGPCESTIVPVVAMPTVARGDHRVEPVEVGGGRARRRPRAPGTVPGQPVGHHDAGARRAARRRSGPRPRRARSAPRWRGSPRPARRTGRHRSGVPRRGRGSCAGRSPARCPRRPARRRTSARMSSRALTSHRGLRRCAATRPGTTRPAAAAGRGRRSTPHRVRAAGRAAAVRPAASDAGPSRRAAGRPGRTTLSAAPSRAPEPNARRGRLHRDRLRLAGRPRRCASTTWARRSTSTDGMSMRTGQTSKQAPHSDEA